MDFLKKMAKLFVLVFILLFYNFNFCYSMDSRFGQLPPPSIEIYGNIAKLPPTTNPKKPSKRRSSVLVNPRAEEKERTISLSEYFASQPKRENNGKRSTNSHYGSFSPLNSSDAGQVAPGSAAQSSHYGAFPPSESKQLVEESNSDSFQNAPSSDAGRLEFENLEVLKGANGFKRSNQDSTKTDYANIGNLIEKEGNESSVFPQIPVPEKKFPARRVRAITTAVLPALPQNAICKTNAFEHHLRPNIYIGIESQYLTSVYGNYIRLRGVLQNFLGTLSLMEKGEPLGQLCKLIDNFDTSESLFYFLTYLDNKKEALVKSLKKYKNNKAGKVENLKDAWNAWLVYWSKYGKCVTIEEDIKREIKCLNETINFYKRSLICIKNLGLEDKIKQLKLSLEPLESSFDNLLREQMSSMQNDPRQKTITIEANIPRKIVMLKEQISENEKMMAELKNQVERLDSNIKEVVAKKGALVAKLTENGELKAEAKAKLEEFCGKPRISKSEKKKSFGSKKKK